MPFRAITIHMNLSSQFFFFLFFFFFFFFFSWGAQWLSGRVLDSRPKGRRFRPHRRHCVVVLEQSLVLVQPRKIRPYITERLLMGRKESNQTNKQTNNFFLNLQLCPYFVNANRDSSENSAYTQAHQLLLSYMQYLINALSI